MLIKTFGIHAVLGRLLRSSSLHVVDLEEALKVQVRYFILVLGTQKLGYLGVRNNATLELGIKAIVLLDIGRVKLAINIPTA